MSAFQALDVARAAGVEVRVDGKDLVLSAAGEPPTGVIDMLRRHKRTIVGLLQTTSADTASSASDIIGSTASNTDGSASDDTTSLVAGVMAATAASTSIDASADIAGSTPIASTDDASTGSADPIAARPTQGALSTDDWLGLYDEKAGIAEFDHGMPREAAEALAVEHCISEWLYQHPVSSGSDDGCPICGAADRPNDDLLPVGLGGGQVWLHRGCSAAWRATRIAEAVAAMAAIGIVAAPHARNTQERTAAVLELHFAPPASSSSPSAQQGAEPCRPS